MSELNEAIVNAIITGISSDDTATEQMLSIVERLKAAGYVIRPRSSLSERETAIEECARIADGMARIGRDLITENNEYQARSGKPATDANKFCQHRVSASEEIAAYIRALPKRTVEQGATNEHG
jgi:hypothetical protein